MGLAHIVLGPKEDTEGCCLLSSGTLASPKGLSSEA